MALCPCRNRLGIEETPFGEPQSDQQIVRLDRHAERGGERAVPQWDPRGGMAPSSGQRQRVPADLESIQQRLPRIGMGIEQIFASYSNPKGNADTERVIRTLKEDLVWPREFDSVQAFEVALKQWVKDYNEDFPHSALNYETPCDYERWFYTSLSK